MLSRAFRRTRTGGASSSGTSAVAGAYADNGNFDTLSVALSDGVPHKIVAADLDPGYLTAIPDGDTSLVVPADGEVPITGGTYLIQVYATAHFDAAPDASVQVSAVARVTGTADTFIIVMGGSPTVLTGSVDLIGAAEAGDDVETDLSPSGTALVAIPGGEATLSMRVNVSNGAATLTEAEFTLARIA